MPDDLAISAADNSGPLANLPKATVARAPAPEISASTTAASAATTTAAAQKGPFPSPVYHLDATLGIEVMQFVDQSGGITQSFPSQRQLDAYRTGELPAKV